MRPNGVINRDMTEISETAMDQDGKLMDNKMSITELDTHKEGWTKATSKWTAPKLTKEPAATVTNLPCQETEPKWLK